MSKSSWVAVIGVAAALLALPAAAQTAMSGFYVGAGVGQSKAKDWCALGGFDSCDDKKTAWKIFGGYQFTPNFAVDAGYTKLGKFTASFGPETEEAKVTAWEASLLAGAPLVGGLSIFGRLGLYRASVEDVDNLFGTFKHDNNDFTYGLGLGYDVTRNLGVRAEWQRYNKVGGGETALGAGVGQKSDVDVLGISALWRF
ncbi:MAG TPA: outer membrane beta-barrel protein [Burkholderiales bacterium]|nr:outer membrane beta-barrel protein [Burkholderiales bacterium]